MGSPTAIDAGARTTVVMPNELEHVKFTFNTVAGGNQRLPLYAGRAIFVVGPNGSGKSSLLQKLHADNRGHARRITAHRQTWLQSNASNLSAMKKLSTDQQLAAQDTQDNSRWRDDFAQQRVNATLFELIDAETADALAIASAVRSDDNCKVEKLKRVSAPLSRLNGLLGMGRLMIKISIGKDQQLFASNKGSDPYSIAELSDGERSAVLLAANVLTAPPGSLMLIDEPERHLHRSISSPLTLALFEERQDCAFVISTHDVSLPIGIPHATTLLLRACTWAAQNAKAWDADVVDADTGISDDIRHSILGSRRKILFVEGQANSTDAHTYVILYPDISVIPRGSYTEVDRAVTGIRSLGSLHWAKAYGLIDRDNRPDEEINGLSKRGIFALDCYSVESLYYSTEIMKKIEELQASISPIIADLSKAKESIIKAVSNHKDRLCALLIENRVRNCLEAQLPNHRTLLSNPVHTLNFDASHLLAEEKKKLEELVLNRDTDGLINRYPVSTTGALDVVATSLGFDKRDKYESAVRKLLVDDQSARNSLRQRLSGLTGAINADR